MHRVCQRGFSVAERRCSLLELVYMVRRISLCSHDALSTHAIGVFLPIHPQTLSVLGVPLPARSRWGGRASCPSRSSDIHAVSLQPVTYGKRCLQQANPPPGTGAGTRRAHTAGIRLPGVRTRFWLLRSSDRCLCKAAVTNH